MLKFSCLMSRRLIAALLMPACFILSMVNGGAVFALPAAKSRAVDKPNAPYVPTWESLEKHQVPEWFEDAKFGMFIDWGLYSVAGWGPLPDKGPTYPDWYLYRMEREYKAYHDQTWGPNFRRDDFIPLFKAQAYDPEKLVVTARMAGMKYVVPFCKHHDGFCLWPSTLTHRNAAEMGPKRDLIGPLVQACHRDGLKFGFYQSLEEWEYPVLDDKGQKQLRVWDNERGTISVIPYDEAAMRGKITGKIPVHDFVNDYIVPQTLEFINAYDPDILWFDGDWLQDANYYQSLKMVADFYNHSAGRKEVAVNDRMGKTRSKHGDFFTSEYGLVDGNEFSVKDKGLKHKWEENRGISQSFGYNRLDTEKNIISGDALVHMLINTVAHNGNLLLIVNLDGQGALPQIEQVRLLQIGKWLQVNGEAIYATRTWQQSDEGDSIRYTRSKDGKYVYAISLGWPGRELRLKSVQPLAGSKIKMLGKAQPLKWKQDSDLVIDIPESFDKSKPCDHAYCFKIQVSR